MKKITNLTETRWRTVHYKDEYGNRYRDQEEYVAKRPVKTIGTGPRIAHYFVDLFLFYILMFFLQFLFVISHILSEQNEIATESADFAFNVVALLLYPFFYTVCEHFWQKTPGKFLTKCVVIDEWGNKPDLKTIILRSFIRLVPFEAFSCFDSHSYGWHDRWSNTWVVPLEELNEIKKLQNEESEII